MHYNVNNALKFVNDNSIRKYSSKEHKYTHNWLISALVTMKASIYIHYQPHNVRIVLRTMLEGESTRHREDLPDASLNGRKPENLKVKELKQWLTCRGASVKGKKCDLVAITNTSL